MKTNLTLLIAGIILVLIGVIFKVGNSSDYSNYVIGVGLLLEVLAAAGFIKMTSEKK